uniref:Ninein n=1 Tax=Oryzias latipes TaxID=8090 RepID=A0A3B3HMZ3_ORYLA
MEPSLWRRGPQGGGLSCGMGDGQEQDHYEERLKEVFDSFDASGCGSLTPEELADLCRSLQLEDATPALLHALLQNQDRLSARVDFQQFKTALIQVLYSTFPGAQEEQEAPPPTASPEIQPKFVKGSKRYGRRSTPEFLETTSGVPDVNPADGSLEDNDDSAVPRKRERWNSQESSSDEFEAEGQMHLWNPDGPSTPRGSVAPLSVRLEAELRRACEELEMAWDGHAARSELLVLCESLGLEPGADALLDPDEQMDVQEFVSRLMTQPKPPTPSASTPYRQLKRHHSTQSFDEVGRRIPAFSSTTATPLFSWLDDGAGHAAAERVLDVWMDEGVENGVEILQSLSVEPDGRLNLCDLAAALESELLVTKNGVLRAALASFKAEIRHLLENVEQEIREKEKIRSDLEKAEKQKSQLASEVDERHAAIERANSLNLRRLEQEHKERLGAVRSELMKEVEQIQQQAGLQREKAEAEIAKIKEEESLLRDHLSISLKENRRLETELLDGAEELEEAQGQILKLQRSLESLMKEKFGDVDPSSADLLLQEERIKQLRSSYEAQCRELQDRIDELQAELQDLHPLSKGHAPTHKALSEELESQSPGMESDPGIGSEEVQPFSLSLEAEMMLERLKEQHLQQMEELQEQLEIKVNEFNRRLEKQQEIHEEQKASLSLRHQEELGALREEMLSVRSHAQELQNQLEGAELKPAAGGEELQSRGAEVGPFRQQLQEALRVSADLEEQLKALEVQQTEEKEQLLRKMEELKEQHAVEISKLKEEQEELLEARKEEKSELERRLSAEWEQEKDALEVSHENQLRVRLEEVKVKFEEEKGELVRRLTEQWEEEKAQLDLQRNETLQVLLEEEMLRLVVDQEEKENSLREQWERERAKLEEHHEEVLHGRILEERLQLQEQSEQRERRLKEEWEKEKLQLEEDYEGMIQERLGKEKEKLEEKEKMEREAAEERELLEERHREAMKELSSKHGEERSALRGELQKLRDDVALERSEAGRLAQENLALRKKISALEEGDLNQEELLETLERLKKEKSAAQKAAETFKRQSRRLEDQNGVLAERNAQSAAHLERLQLKEREGPPAEGHARVAACVSALEAELTNALEDTAQLENRNSQLSQQLCELREKAARSQLSQILAERQNADREVGVLQTQLAKAQEKVKTEEENLQAAARQNARLKADLKAAQQEKDSLKREVAVLHKKLLHTQEKNRTLEAELHSSGKKMFREEAKEQHLLRLENERLQADARGLRNDLVQAREKVHQLDATILSLSKHKQAGQASALKALEQENAALKRELQAQREQGCEAARSGAEWENLQLENEALKAQMSRLSSQLLESFQAQLVGLLPPSPHRVQRGHRAEEPENLQEPMAEQRAAHADSCRRIGGL